LGIYAQPTVGPRLAEARSESPFVLKANRLGPGDSSRSRSVNRLVKSGRTLSAILWMVLSQSTFAADMITVRYSAEDLANMPKQSDFIKTSDLADVLSSKFKDIIVTMTSRQSGSNVKTKAFVESSQQLSRAARMKKLSTLAVTPESLQVHTDEKAFFGILSQQYRKAIEVNTRKQFPVIEKIRSGMKFNLDLKHPVKSISRRRDIPEIRYGLVETDIIPSKEAPPIATLGTISDIHHDFGAKAQVIYTIDKLSNNSTRQVFDEFESDQEYVQHTSMWRRLPTPKINIKIDAADADAIMSDQISTGSVPGARFTFTQVDGLMSSQLIAGGRSDIAKSMTHEIKIPVYAEMSICRKFDYKFKPTQTSAVNILGHSHLPKLNITYAHTAKQARGEWVMRTAGSELSVTAEPRQGWTFGSDSPVGRAGDKVSVAYRKSF
jgi:hypothetical protein